MKKLIKKIPALILLVFFMTFISCTTEITVKLNKDNSLNVSFSAGAGEAFTQMIMSTTGDDGAIDEKQVTYELAKAGFENIKVKVSGKSDVNISFVDKGCTSYLFTSGLLIEEKGKLHLNLNKDTLKSYYDSADQQTITLLDLFLAPIFNDEEMSEEEYLEMVGTFYGEKASREIGNSIIAINIEDAKGGITNLKVPLAKLLVGKNDVAL